MKYTMSAFFQEENFNWWLWTGFIYSWRAGFGFALNKMCFSAALLYSYS